MDPRSARTIGMLGTLIICLASCAAPPKAVEDLRTLSIAQLLDEVDRAKATPEDYLGWGPKTKVKYLLDLRKELVSRYPDWPKEIREVVVEGRIWITMTEEQVLVGWGRPLDINRSFGSWGVHEQWVYGSLGARAYVYFENGKVRSISD